MVPQDICECNPGRVHGIPGYVSVIQIGVMLSRDI